MVMRKEPSLLWDSPAVVSQFQHELPVSSLLNSIAFRTTHNRSTPIDGNIIARRDQVLQGVLENHQQRNDDASVSRHELLPETALDNISEGLYQQLSLGQVRFLEVLPGQPISRIECNLHTAVLEKNRLAYDALSYTWELDDDSSSCSGSMTDGQGTEEESEMFIECNGVELHVQQNLLSAIRRLRDTKSSRNIWVDAICINQDDKAERSQQVQMMNTIYAHAYQVIIWLGDKGFAYNIFASISRLVNIWAKEAGLDDMIPTSDYPNEPQTTDMGWNRLNSRETLRRTPFEQYGGMNNGLNLNNIRALYNCRWFQRLWVVQEVALARSAIVYWGQCEIPWEYIGIAACILRTNYDRIKDAVDSLEQHQIPTGLLNAYFMYRISKSQKLFQPLQFSFHQLLRLTRQFGCMENRDKIFGLLALPTTDQVARGIVPSYEKSDAEVYRDITWALINGSGSLETLSSVQHKREENESGRRKLQLRKRRTAPESTISIAKPMGLTSSGELGSQSTVMKPQQPEIPSWVPQWHFVHTQALSLLEPDESFAASHGTSARIQPTSDPSRLIVSGKLIDNVVNVTHCGEQDFRANRNYPYGTIRGQPAPAIISRYRFSADRYDELDCMTLRPITKKELEEIAATLTGGKDWFGLPVSDFDSHLADFAQCLVCGLLRWTLNDDIYGGDPHASINEPFISVDDLKSQLSLNGNAERFVDAAIAACRERACFKTSSGMIGLGPAAMKVGDRICVLYGASMPFVIRAEGSAYRLIGECYVHRLMAGQGVSQHVAEGEEMWIELM